MVDLMASSLRQRVARLEAHHRLTICAVFGIIVFLSLARELSLPFRSIIGWDAYAASFLALAWTRIFSITPHECARIATLQHASRMIIFVGVLLAACVSLVTVAFLLGSAKDLTVSIRSAHVIGAVATVVISWIMVHTLFTLHYGYLYYRKEVSGKAKAGPGLLFPGDEPQPDYYDFAYFSFVIGMTSQVSDVQIASRSIRRWALLHGVISFGFNTAVLALSINVLSGLF